jgi:hypothetical protein
MGYWRLLLRPLQATAKGAAITLGSTVLSCGLAIQVEKHTNRLFFHMAPHWYANVDYAYGITEEQLLSVRHLQPQQQQQQQQQQQRTTQTQTQTQQPTQAQLAVSSASSASSSSTNSPNIAFSTDTKFVIPNDRSSTSSSSSEITNSKTKVVVIPLGDVLSNALTG